MIVVLFEDPHVRNLYPVTIGRAAFSIGCGTRCLIDQVAELGHPLAAVARPHLRPILEADFSHLVDPTKTAGQPLVLINARLVPSLGVRKELARLLESGQSGLVRAGDSIAVAILPQGTPDPPFELPAGAFTKYLDTLPLNNLSAELPLFEYPHDIVRHHLTTIRESLDERIARGNFQEISPGLFLAEGASLGEHVVADTRSGPIVLEARASIGPYCYLQGPVHIDHDARVIEHAAIKDCVSLGHTTKIGGEVEASIIEPYTNKQHHGFLGHSYLGSWINLGAGTCNSDLKNTYGQVNMRYDGKKVATGMQFLGAIVGDYAKTAINTGIFTGKTVGVCSMVYGFVTTNVPSYVNYARLFGQVTSTPVEVMVATQARMFARRKVTQRPCDIQLLHDMYDLTRHERELGSVPPEPLSL
jgi:glucose-1-phosphate thymidylyltransferase